MQEILDSEVFLSRHFLETLVKFVFNEQVLRFDSFLVSQINLFLKSCYLHRLLRNYFSQINENLGRGLSFELGNNILELLHSFLHVGLVKEPQVASDLFLTADQFVDLNGESLVIGKQSLLFLLKISDLLDKELRSLLAVELVLAMGHFEVRLSQVSFGHRDHVLKLIPLTAELHLVLLVLLLELQVLSKNLVPTTLACPLSLVVFREQGLECNQLLGLGF